MRDALERWSLRPVVEGLMALRGVDVVTAMTVLAEVGDLTRFDSPRELMSFVGLVPSEHTSDGRRRQSRRPKREGAKFVINPLSICLRRKLGENDYYCNAVSYM